MTNAKAQKEQVMRTVALLILLLVSLPMMGCVRNQSTNASGWTVVSEATLAPSQIDQKMKAITARDVLSGQLLARVSTVIAKEGPDAAIAVCQSEAPAIAETVSREQGVRIGRTSDRLRNPKNQPPDWAVSLLAHRPTEPVFLAARDSRFGALLPIHLKPQCQLCHGSPDTIPAAVRSALASRYPQDQATGYAEGDLRGWVWVEVPPTGK